ncbi:hypothetical protein THRCLA_20516 [Thraustotheca clavata]|uniref:Ataxin-2 C-terminal domain-containing protein n=1 Tax=Thraustotheca clavata TaxID=74557 RepID=A0A1W0A6B8_9STRA|nr:hypothetical protein THRCLA_20516 [Thraustotheca clavata]
MKLNPNAASFVPTWMNAPTSVPSNPQYGEWDECVPESDVCEEQPNFFDEAEIDELLAEIERVQIEQELAREYDHLKAQGMNEEAEMWSRWMALPPSPLNSPSSQYNKKQNKYHNSAKPKNRSGPLYNPKGTYAPHNPTTTTVVFK